MHKSNLCLKKTTIFFSDRYFITDYAMDLTNYVGSGGLLYMCFTVKNTPL